MSPPRVKIKFMRQDVITMTQKQLNRYGVLMKTIDGSLTVREAAEALNLSTRQIKRLKKEVSAGGAAALIHKNTFVKPASAISDEVKEKIVTLKKTKLFVKCNFTHFREILEEQYDISLAYSTLYGILTSKSILSPKKRRRFKPHKRRSRVPQQGLLVQTDATPFAWFKGNRKQYSIHGAIDDATGQLLALYMCKNECLNGYFTMLKMIIENFGIPVSLYADRHTIFRSPNADKADVDSNLSVNDTQFGRALKELGIGLIPARSPQAKGRIERCWQTLQSRLPVEFAMRGIETVDEANEFLEEYIYTFNMQFAVEPQAKKSLFRKLDKTVNLDYILCIKDTRKIDAGLTFSYKNRTFKIAGEIGAARLNAGTRVNILVNPAYGIKAEYKNIVFDVFRFIPGRKKKAIPITTPKSKAHKPSPDNPFNGNLKKHSKLVPGESWEDITSMLDDVFNVSY